MYFEWNAEKNEWLKKERNISFEAVQTAVEHDGLLDVHAHPNTEKYPHQKRLIVHIDGYVYIVPCVPQQDGVWFLKTIIPSRKATRDYLP
jgi:uncharacterized DUF497 family protein